MADEAKSRPIPNPGAWCTTSIRRSCSGYGSGRSRTPFTTLNIAELAPMPNARVTMATIVNAGARLKLRPA